MKQILQELQKKVEKLFENNTPGHDIYHLKRVMNTALVIQEKEGGDRLIIAVSALLHDLHRIMQNETGTFCTPEESIPQIRKILDEVDLSQVQKNNILHCIKYHEEYNFSENGKTVNDIETLVLQDADNLDAIGAVGIGRTFSFGGFYKVKMWVPEKSFDRETYDEDVKDPSVIHHFYSKLMKLKDNMNTETGKKMAAKRHRFMELYLEEFFSEWEGKC